MNQTQMIQITTKMVMSKTVLKAKKINLHLFTSSLAEIKMLLLMTLVIMSRLEQKTRVNWSARCYTQNALLKTKNQVHLSNWNPQVGFKVPLRGSNFSKL
jgi:hypothetical protein